ncbi:polyprenyl synthetase family protein [Streptomyces venezuelae]|uniref:Polyprenyl synthetase family protein n=1 Tax=Streptomyces venezuelae TaxID=54571 RepID=A0A5P2CX31_STRVZ|nr:polyprenyl synthetase family protein [Streptomyces venezuelae]QES46547.1 polyprenyl synthetase family protein [Streptomyces venezuelae]
MTHTRPYGTGLLSAVPATATAPATGTGAGTEELLRRGTELVDPLLREVVDRLHPSLATVCRYHLGWDSGDSQGAVRQVAAKRVRAGLALLSVRSVGAAERFAAVAGTAVELVHQLSLLHDDIMDGDMQRRGRPAAWVRFGTGSAVLAGDALVVQAVATVLRAQVPGAHAATEELLVTVEQMVEGQAEDLALERRSLREVSESRYVRMARGKTGALFGCAAALGAVLSDAPPAVVRALRSAGCDLGVAFQILDDVLGLWGDSALTGKPVGADLARGKKTLPLVLAAMSGTADGRWIATLLDAAPPGSGPPAPAQVSEVMRLLEATGSRERAEEAAARHVASAVATLDGAALPQAARQQWRSLIDDLSSRTR